MNPHIANIRQVLAEGRKFWGGQVFIDEESFYVATTMLRKSIPTLTNSPPRAAQILKYLEAIESLTESSKCRLAGRVLVRPSDFEPHLQALEAALRALPPLEKPALSPQEFTVEAAKLEAARIIAEAHREAEEIRQRAREES